MAWTDGYIGIPWLEKGRTRQGCDCWGLVRLVLQEQCGWSLPSYTEDYATVDDRTELSRLVRGETAKMWHPIPLPFAQPWDVAIFRMAGLPIHVGVFVQPGWFLHVMKGCNAVMERLDSLLWSKRLVGIVRYAG